MNCINYWMVKHIIKALLLKSIFFKNCSTVGSCCAPKNKTGGRPWTLRISLDILTYPTYPDRTGLILDLRISQRINPADKYRG